MLNTAKMAGNTTLKLKLQIIHLRKILKFEKYGYNKIF